MSKPRAFVLMPFDASFDEIYNLFIADALVEAGYEVFRADDIQNQRSILKDIIEPIFTFDLVVADLTTNNPNVFYELGIAHALGKKVVLLTQDVNDLPFDLRSYRVVAYSTHFALMRQAKDELTQLAIGAKDNSILFGSPVSDYLSLSGKTPLFPTRIHEVSLSDSEEKGFLDYLADFEEATAEMTEIVAGIATNLSDINKKTRKTSSDIESAKANPSSGTLTHIRRLARKLAKDLDVFNIKLNKANISYQGTLSRIEDGLEFMITHHESVTDKDQDDLRAFLNTLSNAEITMQEARDTFSDLGGTIVGIEGTERFLTRSAREGRDQIRQLVDNIDQTLAIFERARLMGRGKIE